MSKYEITYWFVLTCIIMYYCVLYLFTYVSACIGLTVRYYHYYCLQCPLAASTTRSALILAAGWWWA